MSDLIKRSALKTREVERLIQLKSIADATDHIFSSVSSAHAQSKNFGEDGFPKLLHDSDVLRKRERRVFRNEYKNYENRLTDYASENLHSILFKHPVVANET